MKLVMTLLVRDEADVVEAQIAFHLHAGVDYVIATDNLSQDGTSEVLERFAREGHLHLIRETGTDFRQREWVTRMARLAATDYDADWVINADADEFWWPRGADLKEVLAAVPRRYGVVHALWRSFIPPPENGEFFAERMTVRAASRAPINDPSSTFRPQQKVAHRADPLVVLSSGNHGILEASRPLVPLRGWYPIEILHFPARSMEQWERKNLATLAGWRENPRGFGTAYHEKLLHAHEHGQVSDQYSAIALEQEQLARGLEDGVLATDTRLRDALRSIRRGSGTAPGFLLPSERRLQLPRPTLVDDALFAVEIAALADANLVRLERRIDDLERRVMLPGPGLGTRSAEEAKRVTRWLKRQCSKPLKAVLTRSRDGHPR